MLGDCLAQTCGAKPTRERHFAEASRLRPDWNALIEANRELARKVKNTAGLREAAP